MESVLKIVQSISEADGKSFSEFLNALDEHQSFRLSPADSTAQLITSLLNKATTREQGLFLLRVLLSQSTLDQISQKGQLWITICIKTCNQNSTDDAISLAYQCLELLIVKSVDIPELSKAFSSHLLGKILETLHFTRQGSHLAALRCLETSLKAFPGTCGVFRNIIEKFVGTFVDSTDDLLVHTSGKCLHLLQQVKGSGNAGINPKTAWQLYHVKIIGSLHELLDIIFSNFAESYDEEIEVEKLNINPLDLNSEPVQRSAQLVLRFKNLIKYLIIALGEPYPVAKPIMPKKLLNLINRGLSVNCLVAEKNPISDNIAMGALLPDVHIQLLRLLDVLILTLKTHLAVYAKLILRFIVDTLKWTCFGKSEGFQKPYRTLRIAAYSTLSLWCNVMKCGSLLELVSESLIEQIKCDVTPFHTEVTLKVLSGTKKHMSKKARRLLHKAENERSNIAQVHSKGFSPHHLKKIYSDEGNAHLCASALKCLRNIILSGFCFMKPTIVRDIQEKIFAICSQLVEESTQKERLYWHTGCREALYDVIYTMLICPHHLCPPPAALGITLLEMGQHLDRSQTVRSACLEHLRNIEKILHPQKECLYFPPDIVAIKAAFKNYKRKLTSMEEESSSSSKDEEIVCASDQAPGKEVENKADKAEPCRDIVENSNTSLEVTLGDNSANTEMDTSAFEVEEIEESSKDILCEKEPIPNAAILNTEQETPDESGLLNAESSNCGVHVTTNEASDKNSEEKCGIQEQSIDVSDEEPAIKKSRLEENEGNVDENDKVEASEGDSVILNSILTTFVDELNENPAE